MPAPGDIFDGYELLRPIGQGGFGEVWLCRAPATGDWRALKFIARENAKALDKEFEALARYRRVAAKLRSPGLMPVEHANRRTDGLYYVMPLADGMDSSTPDSSEWRPLTLRGRLDARRGESSWFTGREVVSWMEPVLAGLQCLAEAGLVHRDIKPDNILFFDGKPCLGDISLLTEDGTQITRHGTPGYSTPSWFIGGHHDMYGAAALLYTLLTGNDPDRMGRSAFQWPPQGESSLSPEERQEWLRLHAVVRRATEERPTERYADFAIMQSALRSAPPPGQVDLKSCPKEAPFFKSPAAVALALSVLSIAGFTLNGYGVLLAIAAIGASVIGLQSKRKKTALVAMTLGFFGFIFGLMNTLMENLPRMIHLSGANLNRQPTAGTPAPAREIKTLGHSTGVTESDKMMTPGVKTPDEQDALMKRLAPLLDENDRIARDFERKLNELLAFYERLAPEVLAEVARLEKGPRDTTEFLKQLETVAPKLKALVRPELTMRDDPRIPLSREEWLRRIKETKIAKQAGQATPLTTLLDARIDASIRWENVYEAATQAPANPAEQFWFDKRVSSQFYASPLRVTRNMPPMETLWFSKAAKSGVMKALAEGELRKLVERALLNRQRVETDPSKLKLIETGFDGLMKSALWVEIQTASFMKRRSSELQAPPSQTAVSS